MISKFPYFLRSEYKDIIDVWDYISYCDNNGMLDKYNPDGIFFDYRMNPVKQSISFSPSFIL